MNQDKGPLTGDIFQKQKRSSGILKEMTGDIFICMMQQQANLKIRSQKGNGW